MREMRKMWKTRKIGTRTVDWRRPAWVGVAAAVLWGALGGMGGVGLAEVTNPDGVAVIIGNKDYAYTEDVEFAHRDAEAFRRYVVDVLGFDPKRVLVKRDAPLRWMFSTFGQKDHVEGTDIWTSIRPGKSDVVVFYSGHGVPGLRSGRGYLVPVDAEPDKAEFQAYSLDLLHENLERLAARSVSVFVDACFSGDSEAGMLFKDVSAVRSEARLPEGEKVTLITAATGRQVALWDREAGHGLFTRHLLDGLYGDADADQNGKITAGEAKNYLDEHMTRAAREGPGRVVQTATLRGDEHKVLAVARFPGRSSPGLASLTAELKTLTAELEKARQAMEAVRGERDRLANDLKAKEEALAKAGAEKEALVQRGAELARENEAQRAELAKLKSEQGRLAVAEQAQGKAEGPASEISVQGREVAARGREAERLGGEQAEAKVSAEAQAVAARKAPEEAERELLRPGQEFQDCEECPEMVVVPAGEFMMGSHGNEEGWHPDERPVHRVTIQKAFAVGKYEVTFGEWDACVSGGGCRGYRPEDEGWGRGRRPVVNVSWEDAVAYVEWLNGKSGKEYRLLSEAEWEYVARAGNHWRYWWGNDLGKVRANCVSCGSGWDNRMTAPVGSFRANGFGLYDVHGNAAERVEDCWHNRYDGAPKDGNAWVGVASWAADGDCKVRVYRGGSWASSPTSLRSAYRDRQQTSLRVMSIGFRIARTLAP